MAALFFRKRIDIQRMEGGPVAQLNCIGCLQIAQDKKEARERIPASLQDKKSRNWRTISEGPFLL